MSNNILSLFQLCDSNFPTGAFSHSYGLESYIQEDKVHDQATFLKWLHAYVHEQLIYSDGLASRLVYEALEKDDWQKVWKLDRMLMVQNLPRETREGTQRMGERMLNLVESLYDIPILSAYRERITKKQSFGHSAIVFTIVGHHLEVPKVNNYPVLFVFYRLKSCTKCGAGYSLRTNSWSENDSRISGCDHESNRENSDVYMKTTLGLYLQV